MNSPIRMLDSATALLEIELADGEVVQAEIEFSTFRDIGSYHGDRVDLGPMYAHETGRVLDAHDVVNAYDGDLEVDILDAHNEACQGL